MVVTEVVWPERAEETAEVMDGVREEMIWEISSDSLLLLLLLEVVLDVKELNSFWNAAASAASAWA